MKLFAHLRQAAGTNEVNLEIDSDTTIKDILDMTIKRFGKDFESRLKDVRTGKLAPFLIMIGNKEISSIKGDLNTKVIDGDKISFLEPVGGGI